MNIQLDTACALKEVWKDIIISFWFQITNVVIILVLLLILIKRQIARYLSDSIGYFHNFDIERTTNPSLQLKKKRCEDEIDIMIDAFNSLRESLMHAYREQIKAQEKIKASETLFRVMIERRWKRSSSMIHRTKKLWKPTKKHCSSLAAIGRPC